MGSEANKSPVPVTAFRSEDTKGPGHHRQMHAYANSNYYRKIDESGGDKATNQSVGQQHGVLPHRLAIKLARPA